MQILRKHAESKGITQKIIQKISHALLNISNIFFYRIWDVRQSRPPRCSDRKVLDKITSVQKPPIEASQFLDSENPKTNSRKRWHQLIFLTRNRCQAQEKKRQWAMQFVWIFLSVRCVLAVRFEGVHLLQSSIHSSNIIMHIICIIYIILIITVSPLFFPTSVPGWFIRSGKAFFCFLKDRPLFGPKAWPRTGTWTGANY